MTDFFGESKRLGWPGLPRPRTADARAALFSGSGRAGTWLGDWNGSAYCPACGLKIASVRVPKLRVVLEDDDELGYVHARDVSIGARVTLEPGFVNHRRRHVSGPPWYVRSDVPSRRSPRIRLPAVVTCGCGQDALLSGVDDAARLYATGTEDQRARKAERDFYEEIEDRLTQEETDELRRGEHT